MSKQPSAWMKILISSAFFSFLFGSVAFSGSGRLSEADSLFRTGRGREALALYRALVREVTSTDQPSEASREIQSKALAGELRVALRFGDHAPAESAIALATSEFPGDETLLTLAGHYCFYRGRLEQARQFWEKAVGVSPNSLEARFQLLLLEEQVAPWEDRRQGYEWFFDRYQQGRVTRPEDQEWVGRACVKLEKYQWDGAQKVYQEALDATPDLETVLIAKGDLWLDRYDEEAAIEIYNSVLRKNRESLPAMLGLGLAYLDNGNLGAAKKVLDQALVVNPNHPLALSRRSLHPAHDRGGVR